MKYYGIVSTLVILVLTISVVWGKHKGRRPKDHPRHRHMHLSSHVQHLRQSKSPKTLAYHGHIHRSRLRGHHRPSSLKCRRVKFIVNRNVHLKRKTTDALKRHLTEKQTKRMFHKFTINSKHKKFHLPRETKLFEDRHGNLVTYIEDCVSSENAEKKDFFEGQREMYIEPAFGQRKTQRVNHDHPSSSHSSHHSSEENDVTTVQSSEDEVGDEGILPASEDSLLQTVSDSTEMLKDSAQNMKEGTAQYLNEQHETDVPSNFATVFQAVTVDSPLPKKPEEGSELQRFFSSAGLTNIPRINSEVVTPISQQPLNNLVREHANQLPLPTSEFVSNPSPEAQGFTQKFVSNPSPEAQAFTQNINNPRIRPPLREHPGGYGRPLRDPEETHARFTENNGGNQVQTFSEAFDKLRNAEAQELAGYTNDGVVPQTLGDAMKVESAEANYENSYETIYGKEKSIGLQKGAAYLPEKEN